MLPTSKLTKRQKKFLAFRERKRGKDKLKPLPGTISDSEDEIDVPAVEDQVLADAPQSQQGHQISKEVLLGTGKTRAKAEEAETEARVVVTVARKSKRKAREEDESGESDKPKSKRRRGGEGTAMQEAVEDGAEDGETLSAEIETKSEKTKQRFILFLGNLKYTTTLEAIQGHFSACVPPPTVRLLTPKPSTKSPTKPVTKSKGCAFLEFKHRGALQQGLKLHHSQLDGRQINVELTAGGGGKSMARTKKLKERNKELEGQRRKRQDPAANVPPGGAQRFSATSGEQEIPTHKQTWTVGDAEERGTHRGQKHQRTSKKRGSRVKDFRTGVNAIPVG
ncbi:hypothetical protein JVU11DRAFT_4979 [Chiua virens]|nr:hypothetical protein JVU11DRAFT_4979 [Chiua virens]